MPSSADPAERGEQHTLSISVSLTIIPGQIERFLDAFMPMVRGALEEEEGCLHYALSASSSEPNVFHIYEVYRDQASLDAHRQSVHFRTWSALADNVLAPNGRITRAGQIIIGSLSRLEEEK